MSLNIYIYICNGHIRKDLKIASVADEFRGFAKKHEERLRKHQNIEILQLLDNAELI